MKFIPLQLGPASLFAGLVCILLTYPVSAAQVTLGSLNREYTGSAIVPLVTTDPVGVPVTLLYRKVSPSAPTVVSEMVFNNTPANPPLSYASLNFSGHGVIGLGNYIRLGNNARKLESCEVQLVTWARAGQYPELAALNPRGYFHNVSVALYSLSPDLIFTLLTDQTRSIFIPWRPETLPDGSAYPFNGYAVTARFEFPDGIILPEQVIVEADYDTEATGYEPIGIPGPYNVLNLALDGTVPSVGMDLDADVVLRITKENWFYPNSGYLNFNGPITKLTASSAVTKNAPVYAGTYEVTAIAGDAGTAGTAMGTLTITGGPAFLTFPAWQQREFSPAEITGGKAAAGMDPDGDAVLNFAEFAMGADPHNARNDQTLMLDAASLAIQLVRPRFVEGIRYLAEESPDLITWTPVPLTLISTGQLTETIQARASDPARKAGGSYLRFRFEP